jgi:hypothetical protein
MTPFAEASTRKRCRPLPPKVADGDQGEANSEPSLRQSVEDMKHGSLLPPGRRTRTKT